MRASPEERASQSLGESEDLGGVELDTVASAINEGRKKTSLFREVASRRGRERGRQRTAQTGEGGGQPGTWLGLRNLKPKRR